MKRGSVTQRIMALSLVAVFVGTSAAQLIPDGFSCTPDMPRRSGIYSTPPNINSIKVDLIHVFCGQVSDKYGVGGFHARPGDQDPESVVTSDKILSRKPANEYDYSIYKKPSIYDIREGTHVVKPTISSVWPTVLSMEVITQIITYLEDKCRPPPYHHLCVSDFSVLPGDPTAAVFDVKIIIIQVNGVGRVALTAYPLKRGSCSLAKKNFTRCTFPGLGF